MKHKFIYIVLTIFLISGISSAQTVSKNLSLADYVSYQTLYNGQSIDSTVFTIADIASWEDSRYNKEYALICLEHSGPGSGVAMVEVTDPGNAVYKKTIRFSNVDNQNAPFDVKVYNDILFVAQENQSSHPTYWVELEDAVDNLGSATAGVHTGDLTAGTNIHNMFINKDHELLFLSNFEEEEDIQVYDISGLPGSSPSLVGTIPMEQTGVAMRSHDLYAMETGTNQGRVFDANLVSVTVTDYTWNGSTFSVTGQLSHEFHPRRGQNPDNFSNPFTNEHQRSVHSTWVGGDTDYLFTTVEGASDSSYPNTWVNPNSEDYQRASYLYLWDVNPINPSADGNGYRYPIEKVYEVRENSADGSGASSYFSTLSSEKANSIHNITTRGDAYGDTAFISYYTKGLRVLDVTNPPLLPEIAYYDVPGFEEYVSPAYNGAFGVDPFLPSGITLISSSEGLYVFRRPGIFEGSIDVNTTWTDNIKIVDDVTVASNATLTIDNGTTIEVANGASLTVNGHLQINGTSGSHVAFSNSGTGSWTGIKIISGGTITATYADIENATQGVKFESGSSGSVTYSTISNNTYGVYISGATPTIQNNTISSNSYGIYVSSSYSGATSTEYLKSNTIQSNSSYGIYLYNSSPALSLNTVTGNNKGVALFTNCNPKINENNISSNTDYGLGIFGSSSPLVYVNLNNFGGRNSIQSNGGDEIKITGSSNPNLGNYKYDGQNSIVHASGYLVNNTTSNTINAERNWWGSSSGPGAGQIYGSVDYDPYLDQAPSSPLFNPLAESSLPVNTVFVSRSLLEEAFENYYNLDFQAAANKFRQFIYQSSGKNGLINAINYYYLCLLQVNSLPEVISKINELNNLKLSLEDRLETASLIASLEELDGNYAEALKVLESVEPLDGGTEIGNRIRLQKAHLLIHSMGDFVSGYGILEDLTARLSVNSYLSEIAFDELSTLNKNVALPKKISIELASDDNTPATFSLDQNYPNPFNPTTEISFAIPQSDYITLTVYDVLGNEVAELANGNFDEGIHTIKFDASRLASGIYVYILRAGNFTQSRKMLLMK